MSRKPSERAYEEEIAIRSTPEEVWRALTEPERVQDWFAPEVEIEPGAGGSVRWRWGAMHDWPQRIEVWEPGQRLRTSYASSVDDGRGGKRPLYIDFHLRGEGGGTILRLVHSGFGPEADFDQEYDVISSGWPVELRSLRLLLERHPSERRQFVWHVADVAGDHDQAWRALTGERGLACGAGIDQLAEGSPFRFMTVGGDVFQGTALRCHTRSFSGVAQSHGDGFLCLENFDVAGHAGGKSIARLLQLLIGQLAAARRRLDLLLLRLEIEE